MVREAFRFAPAGFTELPFDSERQRDRPPLALFSRFLPRANNRDQQAFLGYARICARHQIRCSGSRRGGRIGILAFLEGGSLQAHPCEGVRLERLGGEDPVFSAAQLFSHVAILLDPMIVEWSDYVLDETLRVNFESGRGFAASRFSSGRGMFRKTTPSSNLPECPEVPVLRSRRGAKASRAGSLKARKHPIRAHPR